MITDNELLELNKEFNQQDINITMEELIAKDWIICADNIIVANASLNYEEVRNKIIEFIGR